MIHRGIDWAERTHDVALVDDTGVLLAKHRITDDAAGYTLLPELLAEHGDFGKDSIPVAIETSRGLLVAVLRAGIRQVFAINPMAAARHRDLHSVSRKKSDPGDALALANILRTDMHAHRPLSQDSDLARAVAVLARAQQDATWNRRRIASAALPAARVLPGHPGSLRALDQRAVPTRSPRAAQDRPDTRPGCAAAPHPAPVRSQAGRPPARHRRRGRSPPRRLPLQLAHQRPSSKTHSASRPSPSPSNWKPPAPPPTSSPTRRKRRFLNTRTPRCC